MTFDELIESLDPEEDEEESAEERVERLASERRAHEAQLRVQNREDRKAVRAVKSKYKALTPSEWRADKIENDPAYAAHLRIRNKKATRRHRLGAAARRVLGSKPSQT